MHLVEAQAGRLDPERSVGSQRHKAFGALRLRETQVEPAAGEPSLRCTEARTLSKGCGEVFARRGDRRARVEGTRARFVLIRDREQDVVVWAVTPRPRVPRRHTLPCRPCFLASPPGLATCRLAPSCCAPCARCTSRSALVRVGTCVLDCPQRLKPLRPPPPQVHGAQARWAPTAFSPPSLPILVPRIVV